MKKSADIFLHRVSKLLEQMFGGDRIHLYNHKLQYTISFLKYQFENYIFKLIIYFKEINYDLVL